MLQYARPDVLVDTQWLMDRLKHPNIRIVEVDMSSELYKDVHIPGAVFWNILTDLLKPDLSINLDPIAMGNLMSRSGISYDTAVIAYGSYPGTGALIFWLLKIFRHRKCKPHGSSVTSVRRGSAAVNEFIRRLVVLLITEVKLLPRSSTSTFVTEIPLIVDSSQEKELLSRFQAGRQLYNALLNEAMVRMELVRDGELYKQAKKFPLGKDRDKVFAEARKVHRYSDYDLQAYATIVSNNSKWIADKIDSNTQQKLATRAFKASERVLFGRARRVRYKVPNRFRSLEGKTNSQGIRWKEDNVIWGKLKLKGIIEAENPVVEHGLNSPIKYVRLLWRELNGKRRWYAQIIGEGLPYQKPQNQISDGLVGLDLNISNIAFVANNSAGLLPFAQGVPTFEREIQALQRRMQRSQRSSNPNNYQPDWAAKKGRKTVIKKGLPKKGKRTWNKSKTYIKYSAKKREMERRKTAYAKSQNRKVVNEILRHGNQIKTENVSVKGWQKRYGKAIRAKSPGLVQSELKRKAESAGGSMVKFSCQKTALSQTHLTGERIKKSLSERVHYDKSGFVMHRDLFSAYLARFVNQDELSFQDAINQYPGSEPILVEAWKQYQQSVNRVSASESGLADSPLERISQKLENYNQIAVLCKQDRATSYI